MAKSNKKELRARLEKERIKQKKEFNSKNQELIEKAAKTDKLIIENEELKKNLANAEGELRELKEWIERLLEYMDMDKEEFKKLREEAESWSRVADSLEIMTSFSKKFGGYF